MSELLAASRFSSIGLSLVSAEPETPEAFAHQMLRSRTQIRLARDSRNGRRTMEDLLIGRADVCLCSLPAVLPHVASGALRIIALLSPTRSLALPHVPTAAEELKTGIFDLTHWIGVFAPRGTPSTVAEQINREVNRILGQPEVREHLLSRGTDLRPMSVDEFAHFVDAERRKYADLGREADCLKAPSVACSRSHVLP
jgi:tripartite-type tricarboxylate transporter receptor subunit TctC